MTETWTRGQPLSERRCPNESRTLPQAYANALPYPDHLQLVSYFGDQLDPTRAAPYPAQLFLAGTGLGAGVVLEEQVAWSGEGLGDGTDR